MAANETSILLNGIDISLSYGEYQIATIISCILFGITTMQVYLYYWNYFELDAWLLKGLVGAMWLMDLANLTLIIRGEWNAEVLKWGKVSELLKSQGPSVIHSDIEAVVVVIVQGYLIRRVWLLLKKKTWFDWAVLYILPVLTSWQIIGDICYQIYGLNKSLAVLATPRDVGLNVSMRAAGALVDLTVTAYMVRILASQRSMGFKRTRQMISRMLVVVINTGLFTAMIAVACLIALVARPNDLYWIVFEYPICTAYFSCFLANLNSRNFIKGPGGVISIVDTTFHASPAPSTDPVLDTYHMTPSAGSNSAWSRTDSTRTEQAVKHKVNINIHTDQFVTTNGDMDASDMSNNAEKASKLSV